MFLSFPENNMGSLSSFRDQVALSQSALLRQVFPGRQAVPVLIKQRPDLPNLRFTSRRITSATSRLLGSRSVCISVNHSKNECLYFRKFCSFYSCSFYVCCILYFCYVCEQVVAKFLFYLFGSIWSLCIVRDSQSFQEIQCDWT